MIEGGSTGESEFGLRKITESQDKKTQICPSGWIGARVCARGLGQSGPNWFTSG